MRKEKSQLGRIIILTIFFIALINPFWIPILSKSQKSEIANKINLTFGKMDEAGALFNINLPILISIVLVVVFVLIIYYIIKMIIGYFDTKDNRRTTVLQLMLSLVRYTCAFVGVCWVLSVLGVNTSAIFASLGLVGVVVGLGAQSVVADILTGGFLVFEGYYNVGDVITIGDFRGIVKEIGLRTTCIEDMAGNVKVINNSDMRNFQNRSQNLSFVYGDIGIGYDEDLLKVEEIFNNGLSLIREKYKALFVEEIIYLGVQELAGSSVVLRVATRVEEKDIYVARRILNKELKLLFDENNINIPYDHIVIKE